MKKQTFRRTQAAELYRHICEAIGCNLFGPFGYGPIKRPDLMHWFCRDHRPATW